MSLVVLVLAGGCGGHDDRPDVAAPAPPATEAQAPRSGCDHLGGARSERVTQLGGHADEPGARRDRDAGRGRRGCDSPLERLSRLVRRPVGHG